MSVNQIQKSQELDIPVERRGSISPSEAGTTITQAVARAQQGGSTMVVDSAPLTEQQELQNLRQIIVTWRELEAEASTLSTQVREKKKRQKALEEMILRIMKKNNIGALDLK